MFNKSQFRFLGTKEIKQNLRNQSDKVITRRFYIIMIFIIVILFIYLIRLFSMQITKHDYYMTKLDQYNTNTFTVDAQRGEIVDRNYKKLVYNENLICTTYYAVSGIKDAEIKGIVNFLLKNCKVDISSVTQREKKDYLMMKDKNFVDSLVTKEEKQAMKGDDYDTKLYNLQLNRITDSILKSKLSDQDIKFYKLYYAIKSTTSGSIVLLEGISVDEASLIGENTDLLRGIQVTIDWKREYTNKTMLKSILGRVTTKRQGLPSTLRTQLLALDYNNDARIGVSGLEKEYENTLRGSESSYELQNDAAGNPIVKSKNAGSSGNNIQLTIDSDIQKELGDFVEKELKSHSGEKYNKHIYSILIQPKTGDIIAMVGKRRMDNGKIVDWESGAYTEAYEIGSTMKAATLYTCFKNHIIQPNHYEMDDAEGIKIKGTPAKHSWRLSGLGNLNEISAMAYSSNIYMMKIIIKLGGGTYRYNQPLSIDTNAFTKLRNAASELGLGVKSGLDVPNEALGYRGKEKLPGKLLDFSIGQYDTYTPIQLATYVSTLANNGVRVQPHLYKSSFVNDSDGNNITLDQHHKTIMEDVSSEKVAFQQIRKGMRAVITYGTPSGGFASYPYEIAAKTGTAQVGSISNIYNHIFIGYGPYSSDPEIACVVMVELQQSGNSGPTVFRKAVDLYFKRYGYKGKKV